jgi:copper chaperone
MTNAERTYTVNGMSCGHCALSVREEVAEVAGVDQVNVDLDSGRLTVAGAGFSDEDIRAAVVDAGYDLAAAAANGGGDGGAAD